MLKIKNIFLYITIFTLFLSCSSEVSSVKTDFKGEKSPIYYKRSISSQYSSNQNFIDENFRLLKHQQTSQIENYQILGSWFGNNNSEWFNLTISSLNNNMISGFIVRDTLFKTFKGWFSSSDNINYSLGITDEGVGDMNYYELNISLEKMNISGSFSKVSSEKNNSEPNPIVLKKRNLIYNVTTGQYPEFSQREIELSELNELSKSDLNYICEEILARHGLIFFNENSRNLFSTTKWYIPRNFKVDQLLTDLERKNLDKIYTLF
jgi:hypothetical protein